MTKALRFLPWVGVLLSAALVAALWALIATRPATPGLYTPGFGDLMFSVGIGVFAPVGALIASRRPDNPIGWIALMVAFFVTLNDAMFEYAVRSVFGDVPLPGAAVVAWLQSWIWTIGFGLMGLLMLLFPTGTFPSKRWRPVVAGLVAPVVVMPVLLVSAWGREPRYFLDDAKVEADLGWAAPASLLLLFGGLMLAFLSLVVRYRRAAGDERRQLKWVGYAAAVIAFFIFCNVFVFQWARLSDTVFATVVGFMGNAGIVAFPLSVGMAMFKYRLYDIDVVVNRTLVYATLTGVLVGVYALGVLLFRALLDPLTGDNDVAIAASTLAVAALFGPARRSIQWFIDRRFYRSRYDAQQTLEGFAARVRDEVDLDALSVDLLRVVSETVQPRHASVWLAPGAER